MAVSPTLRGVFAGLLVLSLGFKVNASIQTSGSGEPMEASTVLGEVATFLSRQGFQPGEAAIDAEIPFVTAASGNCRLSAFLAAPEGWQRDIIHRLGAPVGETFFVYRGAAHADQPTWSTLTDHYWRWLNRIAGRRLPIQPVLGIAAAPACDLQAMPWRELAELPLRGMGR